MRRLVLVFVAACSGPFADDILITDASVIRPDATTDALFFDDAADGGDATIFNGGGPFLCNDCICDGTLNYCGLVDASIDAGDAAACTKASACQPFPIACLPKPTCACLDLVNCSCDVDPSGNGLVIVCP